MWTGGGRRATGGVGQFAVQLAAAAGATVTAQVSGPDRAAEALELGAHHVVTSLDDAALGPLHLLHRVGDQFEDVGRIGQDLASRRHDTSYVGKAVGATGSLGHDLHGQRVLFSQRAVLNSQTSIPARHSPALAGRLARGTNRLEESHGVGHTHSGHFVRSQP
jgi:Zn-dependent alcohol dehydrogenase